MQAAWAGSLPSGTSPSCTAAVLLLHNPESHTNARMLPAVSGSMPPFQPTCPCC